MRIPPLAPFRREVTVTCLIVTQVMVVQIHPPEPILSRPQTVSLPLVARLIYELTDLRISGLHRNPGFRNLPLPSTIRQSVNSSFPMQVPVVKQIITSGF